MGEEHELVPGKVRDRDRDVWVFSPADGLWHCQSIVATTGLTYEELDGQWGPLERADG